MTIRFAMLAVGDLHKPCFSRAVTVRNDGQWVLYGFFSFKEYEGFFFFPVTTQEIGLGKYSEVAKASAEYIQMSSSQVRDTVIF